MARIVFTAPTGHTYSTQPPGRMLFPVLKQSAGELPIPVLDEPATNRALMMPQRKQTREQDRRDRIIEERRQRTELIAEEERQRQAWLAAGGAVARRLDGRHVVHARCGIRTGVPAW